MRQLHLDRRMALYLLVILSLLLALGGCSAQARATAMPTVFSTATAATEAPPASDSGQTSGSIAAKGKVEVEAAAEEDSSEVAYSETSILFSGSQISVSGQGVQVSGNTATIQSAGYYRLSGQSDDGHLIVDTADAETVHLVLDGLRLSSATGTPLLVAQAEKVVLELEAGTENVLSDSASYPQEAVDAGEPDAALYSTADLTIKGEGALLVQGNYRHGIVSKDSLKITGGTLTVQAVADGLRGRDEVTIRGGTLAIDAGSDGIQSNNNEDPERGTVQIEGGQITIEAGFDGIQAATDVIISGGTLSIRTGGGSPDSIAVETGMGRMPFAASTEEASPSRKGIKADGSVQISGGELAIDAADDALHANGAVKVTGGTLALASGDDAIHADESIAIDGAEIVISQSYEGLESANITLAGGTVRITAADDGVNIVAPADQGGAVGWSSPGQASASGRLLAISGGYLAVDAQGDGFDINGSVTMTGGTVLIHGPASDGNGALDYDGSFGQSGGLLMAVGSAGMAMAPDSTSTQPAVLVTLPETQQAGTPIHIATSDGLSLITFVPLRAYRSLVFSSPELEVGDAIVVYTGGSVQGTATDGLITDGSYTPGTQVAELTLASVITGSGNMGGWDRPGRRP